MAGSTLKMPPVVTLILALVLGAAQVVNETVLSADVRLHTYITIGLVVGAALGVKALAGGAFAAALKLPQWANVLIGAAIAGATLALVSDTGLSQGAHAVIAAALTILAALGFGPPGEPLASAPARKAHR